MEQKNEMTITFDSRSCNEGFVRVAVAAFCTQLNPTLEKDPGGLLYQGTDHLCDGDG